MEFVKPGNSVLVLWANNNGIEKLVEKIKSISNVNVNIENVERLSLAGYSSSTFDVVLSNLTSCPTLRHNNELLAKLLKLLKPNGTLVLREPVATPNDMSLNIKTSGFTAVSEAKPVELSDDVIEDLKSALNAMTVNVNEFKAQKPNFEVGSSVKLSFASKTKAAAIWKLDDSDDEVIDSDNLLDDDDLVKPDPASLRVCGTTGKRKACKDCSCGLAEELKSEGIKKTDQNQTQKSSCGSCYLGDAFRCATCPYLGMPAFKPGEKIQLSDRQLKADS